MEVRAILVYCNLNDMANLGSTKIVKKEIPNERTERFRPIE